MSVRSFLQQNQRSFLLPVLLFSLLLVQSQKSISSATIDFEFVSKKVDGTIGGFRSVSEIDLENLAASKIEGSVDVNTIKTGNFLRDWALKGGKYFDEDKHPRITFTSTSIVSEGDQIKVNGNLSIKGSTQLITIYFTETENTLNGTTTLFSSDFGIQIKKKREDNKVDVNFKFILD